MRPIQRIISVGFATAAFASAALPVVSGTLERSDVDAVKPLAEARPPLQVAQAAMPAFDATDRR